MTTSTRSVVRPLFIDCPTRRLFATHYLPADGRRRDGAILYVPPFAEEMNRSRRMAALQARAFATSGMEALLLDLFGTGDSSGDFGEARLSSWLDDIVTAADWLERQDRAVTCLWGLRLGGLLASVVAASRKDRFKHLLLWQPVVDGRAMLTQFLRIRVAASMSGAGTGEKTEDLRARLAGGQSIEIAGYELHGELAQAIDGLRMDRLSFAAGTRVDWLEVSATAGDPIAFAGQRVVEGWRGQGAIVSTTCVSGDPFWAIQETTLVPPLIVATMGVVESCLV
jgi:exosortase A-associated hydrolase 2